MIPTLLMFLLVLTTLGLYSLILLTVFSVRAFHNGYDQGWREGRTWRDVQSPNVTVLPRRPGGVA